MANVMAGLEEKIAVQNRQLQRNLARLLELTEREARTLTINTAKKFAGAAANAMPPGSTKYNPATGTEKHVSSAKIPATMLYRRVRDLSNPDEINGQHREFLRNAHYGKNKWAFAVHSLTPRRRFKFFATEAEAKKFAAIPTRGSAKYGWLQGVVALGGAARSVTPASFPFSGNAGKLMEKAGTTLVLGGENPHVEITNNSTAAGSMHLMRSELAGKRLANAGLRYAIRDLEKKMQQEFDL